jgi:lipopolysaccharide export system protein LptA
VSRRGRRVRRLSAFLLAAWLVGIVVILVQRQLRRRPTVAPEKVSELASAAEGSPVQVQKGFVYNDVLGVEPNFRIAARETVKFASGWYELRDVDMALFRPGAASYGLAAGRARFNPAEKEAIAEQNVQLSLGGGISVRGDRFTLHGAKRTLRSEGTVTFAGPGWGGLGGELTADLGRDRVDLNRGVSISWRGNGNVISLVILAPQMEYERKRALLHCPAGITFLRGSMRLRSAAADLRLDPETGRLVRIELSDPVHMAGTLEDGSLVQGDAGATQIQPLEGDRYRVTAASAADGGWVRFMWNGPGGVERTLDAWRLVGEGSDKAWEWLEGQELVCASETVGKETVRDLAAGQLHVTFAKGRPATARAKRSVRVELENGWAEGDELLYSLANRSFTLLPPDGGWVEAGSEGLDVFSDRVEGEEGGAVQAVGHVHGTIEEGGATGADDRPTRFASDSAMLGGATVVLKGDARLWQSERLIRADELDYDRSTAVVTGKGEVLTTGVTDNGHGEEMRVRASSLRYDRQAGIAQYSGNVTLEDPRADTKCQQLSVDLGSNGGIRLANLEGGVVITERDTGRVVKGDRARVVVATNVVQVWGSPVVITEPGGNQVSGSSVTWDRSANSVLVEGTEENPSETLYKPGQELTKRGKGKPAEPKSPGPPGRQR